MKDIQNLRIVDSRYTIREGLRVRGVADFEGQKVSFKTNPFLENRLDFYDWTKTPDYLFSITVSTQEIKDLIK